MNIQKWSATELLSYALPLFVILSSVVVATSSLLQKYPELAIGITYDLTILSPLLFLVFTLSSKTKKNAIKAIPIFILGILLASYLLPPHLQNHLYYIKTYGIPIVEIFAFAFVLRKILHAYKTFARFNNTQQDFLELCKETVFNLSGNTKYAAFFISEITMLYYTFFAWRKKASKALSFTNYKENATIALVLGLMLVLFVEIYVFHVALLQWSAIAAWILTATSIYTVLILIGHIKALLLRPILLEKDTLRLKNGLIANCTIALENIEKVVACSTDLEDSSLRIGNMGITETSTNHNIALYFTAPQIVEKIYGFNTKCDVLLLHVDEKDRFIRLLHTKCKTLQ